MSQAQQIDKTVVATADFKTSGRRGRPSTIAAGETFVVRHHDNDHVELLRTKTRRTIDVSAELYARYLSETVAHNTSDATTDDHADDAPEDHGDDLFDSQIDALIRSLVENQADHQPDYPTDDTPEDHADDLIDSVPEDQYDAPIDGQADDHADAHVDSRTEDHADAQTDTAPEAHADDLIDTTANDHVDTTANDHADDLIDTTANDHADDLIDSASTSQSDAAETVTSRQSTTYVNRVTRKRVTVILHDTDGLYRVVIGDRTADYTSMRTAMDAASAELSEMAVVQEWDSYNARRYGKPWIARITRWDVGANPELMFGRAIDRCHTEIIASVGDVIRSGQRDHRGNNTTKYYEIVTGLDKRGSPLWRQVTPTVAREFWMAKMSGHAKRWLAEHFPPKVGE